MLISTLLLSICRSSCLFSRNTNISSGLDLFSVLLLKIRHFFYILSLNIEWQGRLVNWLASHFTSIRPEHKTWCVLPGIKIIGKILLVLSTSEKKPPEWLSKLWLIQENNRSSLFCGCQIKSGLPFFFWRTCFNKTQISTNPDGLCFPTGWSNSAIWLWRQWLCESTSNKGFSTNHERQLPVLLMIRDDI